MGTSTKIIILLGAVVIISGTIGFIIAKKKIDSAVNEEIMSLSNDNLVVDKLSGSDLTQWFKDKNTNNTCSNIIMYPTEKNKKKYHIMNLVQVSNDNTILQFIYDEKNEKVVNCRTVMFEEIDSGLSDILKQNDGVILVK